MELDPVSSEDCRDVTREVTGKKATCTLIVMSCIKYGLP